METDWQRILQECKRNFAKAHRRFGMFKRPPERIMPPPWLVKNPSDKLHDLFRAQDEIFLHGVVAWGAYVQANSLLFQPGKASCPADVLFAEDVGLTVDPQWLRGIAREIFSLKDTNPEESDLARVAKHLTDEQERVYGIPVPESLTGHTRCLINVTFVTRSHLPNGILQKMISPIIVTRDSPRYVLPLPSAYWPEILLKWWMSEP